MSDNILKQIVKQLLVSPIKLFTLQLDESTDVSSCSQLMVYCRYIHNNKFKYEFLSCRELETTTRTQDVFELIDSFFQDNKLEGKDLCGVCSDGAPAMLGSRSGFRKLVKNISPQVTGVHCVIHRQALACKTMPPQLLEMMSTIIKIVNFIKSSALNTRLFRELCEDMTASHQNTTLLHSNERSEVHLAYLVDIFDLNGELNAFQMKLKNWKREIENRNICMFEGLSELFEKKDIRLDEDIKGIIIRHLAAMESDFPIIFLNVVTSNLLYSEIHSLYLLKQYLIRMIGLRMN
ncbi:Protein ZBED8-like [Oopsacas minuta]|uniref:Protein ZBED8-like n=1 Tax=Oopsacas minuta TaxID=111878 RepID=A0AAV7JTY2_9METZ|nr:Protein ZBED8-like [Oopsacas minuta]